MSSLVDLLNDHTPVRPPFGRVLVISALFALAWLISRIAGRAASLVVGRAERRRSGDTDDTGVIASLMQRETAISMARTSVAFVAYALAALLSLGVVVGADSFETLVGASFLVILLAFASQRFLVDVIAGLLMFHERWFRIGDTVVTDPWSIQGVVEGATLRSVAVRSVGGELIRISNSEIKAVRKLPRGYRDVEIELFVSEADAGRELVREVAGLVPVGPTHFLRRPLVTETESLESGLHRIHAVTAVPLGREWLAEDLLPSLIQERADDALVVHGPVVMWFDESAERRFARATRTPLAGDRRRTQARA